MALIEQVREQSVTGSEKAAPDLSRRTWTPRAVAGMIACAGALLLLLVFWRPRSASAAEFVTAAIVAAILAGALYLATFWRCARVRIGRMKLRYKRVRQTAGIVALAGLAPVAVLLVGRWRNPLPPAPKIVVLLPHLEGDRDGRVEQEIAQGLRELRLPLAVFPIDQTITAPPAYRDGFSELITGRGDELLWGRVVIRNGQEVAELHESSFYEADNFGRTYSPAAFSLPALPPSQLIPVIKLMFATIVADSPRVNHMGALRALDETIATVKMLREMDAARRDMDSKARVDFMLGVANAALAGDGLRAAAARDAIYYYLCAYDGWRGPSYAGDRAMTLSFFASAVEGFGPWLSASDTRKPVEQVLRAALAEAPAGDPRDRADLQSLLGDALMAQADYGDTAHLRAAMEAYQAALQVFTKERMPRAWAALETKVAQCEATMARSDTDTTRQRDAIRLLADVFTVRTRAAMPYEWAVTQELLGEIQLDMSDRLPGQGYDAAAVTSERAALEVFNADDTPDEWGRAEDVLGTALGTEGEHSGSPNQLKEAIATLREGATARLRQRAPGAWVQAQLALSTALISLAQAEWSAEAMNGTRSGRFDDAAQGDYVAAMKAAQSGLAVASEAHYPFLWASLESKLGRAQEAIGELEAYAKEADADYHLTQAVAAERAALRVFSLTVAPVNWADAQGTLGDALSDLGENDRNTAELRDAVGAYRLSEIVESRAKDPADWRAQQHSLDAALVQLGTLENGAAGVAHLEEGLKSETELLKTISPDDDFNEWLNSMRTLASAEKELGRREGSVTHLKAAAAIYQDELQRLSSGQEPAVYQEAEAGLSEVNALLRARGAAG